jgi:hypothetical protein
MFRPVTITHPVVVNDGKPFEALTVKEVVMQNGTGYMIDTPAGFFLLNDSTREQVDLKRASITFQLAQALNPPIKVTQAVLKAMEKVPEAKFWVVDDENRYRLIRPSNAYVSLNDSWENGRDCGEDNEGIPCYSKLQIGDYIQADDCPLALQVLLGFTTEGVPKDD